MKQLRSGPNRLTVEQGGQVHRLPRIVDLTETVGVAAGVSVGAAGGLGVAGTAVEFLQLGLKDEKVVVNVGRAGRAGPQVVKVLSYEDDALPG